ncbi:hypothetical protein ACETRX_35710 [Labrys portucalensis]|uniref:SnoaL-like domain-containing protein n=1 Tax=Labrys neptuniae TaxID=376174 RepID=A0ABV6ZS07_9HYPH
MDRRTFLGNLALGTVIIAMGNQQSFAAPLDSDHKRQVVDFLKSIETGDPAPASIIYPNHYTQHNLMVSDGVAGLRAAQKQPISSSARMKTVRVYQDGDFVFAHAEYEFFGPKIGFDIFRFENGLIVEHWDNLQEMPIRPNPSGRTMIDGATEVGELEKTDANKAPVKGLVEELLGQRRMDRVSSYVDPVTYIQHNPHVGDGADAMVAAFRQLDAAADTPHRYTHVRQLLGEGSFVLAASEGVAGDGPTAFYDLFRVANRRIVEHWDVLETIPARGN